MIFRVKIAAINQTESINRAYQPFSFKSNELKIRWNLLQSNYSFRFLWMGIDLYITEKINEPWNIEKKLQCLPLNHRPTNTTYKLDSNPTTINSFKPSASPNCSICRHGGWHPCMRCVYGRSWRNCTLRLCCIDLSVGTTKSDQVLKI